MKNNILEVFKKPSENLKKFIFKNELLSLHEETRRLIYITPVRYLDKENLLRKLSKEIMKEKKNHEAFFVSFEMDTGITKWFYGTIDQVKEKIKNRPLNRCFFCAYDFVNDEEVPK